VRGTRAKRWTAAVAVAVAVASFACGTDAPTPKSASAPESSPAGTAEEPSLTKDRYLEAVDELCTNQAEVVKLAHSADNQKEFLQTLVSHFDETVTFIEDMKGLDPPAAYQRDHSVFVAHEEELQEVDELLNQLPRSDVASVLAAYARRAQIAEDAHYAVKFSKLPKSCLLQNEVEVLTASFFTEANLSCFNFAVELGVLFQQEANRPGARFGARFIDAVYDRADQLITELGTAMPDIEYGFKKVVNMVAFYSEAVESLGDLQKALARHDVAKGTAAIEEYERATAAGDRLAKELRMGCVGAMTIDWRPVHRERIN
jgi:hypothetical protein